MARNELTNEILFVLFVLAKLTKKQAQHTAALIFWPIIVLEEDALLYAPPPQQLLFLRERRVALFLSPMATSSTKFRARSADVTKHMLCLLSRKSVLSPLKLVDVFPIKKSLSLLVPQAELRFSKKQYWTDKPKGISDNFVLRSLLPQIPRPILDSFLYRP